MVRFAVLNHRHPPKPQDPTAIASHGVPRKNKSTATEPKTTTRLIVGITGATGTIFGVRLLQMLHGSGVETHLVMSKWASRTLTHETPYSSKEVQALATESYRMADQGA